MPSIVQFMHPGGEHGPDNQGLNYKSWNHREHKRKFIKAAGSYIVEGTSESKKGDLVFWGEWEPPSSVINLDDGEKESNPKWLHTRMTPLIIPECGGLQNTDPFVFDGPFRYFLCHQIHPSTMNPTKLAKPILDKGSLILYGSNLKQNGVKFFLLDTVFVVDTGNPYFAGEDNRELFTINENDQYYDISYLRAFPNKLCNSLELCLYKGATWQDKDQNNEMYSFVPSKVYSKTESGFSRVKFKSEQFTTIFDEFKANNLERKFKDNENFINDKLTQNFKITKDVDIRIIKKVWNKIVEISRSTPNECVEGVEFH